MGCGRACGAVSSPMYAVQRASTSAVLASLPPPPPPPSRADAPVAARSGAGLTGLALALMRLLFEASAARRAGVLGASGLGPGSDPFWELPPPICPSFAKASAPTASPEGAKEASLAELRS